MHNVPIGTPRFCIYLYGLYFFKYLRNYATFGLIRELHACEKHVHKTHMHYTNNVISKAKKYSKIIHCRDRNVSLFTNI